MHAKFFLFCFNTHMSFEILNRQTVKFYEKQGVKFFEGFTAVDKAKKPVKVYFDHSVEPSILVENSKNQKSFYTLNFEIPKRQMQGVVMNAEPQKKGIGEILNLAALMEFHQNMLNYFKIFSLNESIQFHARYGFQLINDDVDEIARLLKLVINSKQKHPKYDELRYRANFYYQRITGQIKSEDKHLKQRACGVPSKYLQELSKDKIKIDPYKLRHSSHMLFDDWQMVVNKDFLNSLLDEHKINYKF